jgi:hypothetical protein
MADSSNIVCVVCSVFRCEFEALRNCGDVTLPARYIDSVLHLEPERLQIELGAAIGEELDTGKQVVLIYGDCHAYMLDDAAKPGVARVDGVNCCQIMLGERDFRALRREGAFFLLPEWTLRWREVLPIALGSNDKEAWNMMREAHTKLVYLDTGLCEIPHKTLAEISGYSGLPYEIVSVSLEHLKAHVVAAIERLGEHDI